jgi:hypothetical protein
VLLSGSSMNVGSLPDVVNSHDARFNLGLTEDEKHDLIEYLKSL